MPAPSANTAYVVFTSADGTARRSVPSVQLGECSWQVDRYGGYGQGSFNAALDYRLTVPVLIGDRIEVFQAGVRLYRGYTTARLRDVKHPRELTFTTSGASFFARRQYCTKNYAFPAANNGVDISRAFSDLCVDSLLATVGPQDIVMFSPVVDSQTVGTTISQLSAQFRVAGDVLDDLMKTAGNLAIWGADVDSTGANRLYCRPLQPVSAPTWTRLVPASRVQGAQGQEQSSDIVNTLIVKGGQPQFEQLIPNGNFSLPISLAEGAGNLVQNPSFEVTTGFVSWSMNTSASFAGFFAFDAYIQGPFQGDSFGLLQFAGGANNGGANFDQVITGSLVGGDTYQVSLYAKEAIDAPTMGVIQSTGHVTAVVKDSGGTTLLTTTVSFAGLTSTYQFFGGSFVMPAGAHSVTITVTADSLGVAFGQNNAICIDLVELQDTSVSYQENWQLIFGTGVTINAINWQDQAETVNPLTTPALLLGMNCVLLDATLPLVDSGPNDAELISGNQTITFAQGAANPPSRITVTQNQIIRFSCWAKYPTAGAVSSQFPDFALYIDNYASDNSFNDQVRAFFTGGAGTSFGDWTYYEFITNVGNAASVWPRVILRSTGAAVFTAISLQDINAPDMKPVSLGGDGAQYQPQGRLQYVIRADDSADLLPVYQETYPSAVATPYANSISTYGVRSDEFDSEDVINRQDALVVANNRFISDALPLMRPTVTFSDDVSKYWPGDSVALLGLDGQSLTGGQVLTIARLNYKLGKSGVVALEHELGREAPSDDIAITKIIALNARRNGWNAAPNASSGGYGGSSAIGAGGTSPGVPFIDEFSVSGLGPYAPTKSNVLGLFGVYCDGVLQSTTSYTTGTNFAVTFNGGFNTALFQTVRLVYSYVNT